MMEKHYYIFFILGFSLSIVSSLHPSNFKRTKAEDIDDSYSGDILNVAYTCDLTSQSCDINCCSDQDCSEQEKQSFQCSNKEYKDDRKFSYLDCENLNSLNSIGNPLLCLHDQNSPYLGDFYEDENFSSSSFSEILAIRNKAISSFRITDLLKDNHKNKYTYGSNVLFLDNERKYHYINIFSNVVSKENGYCSKVPLRFLIDETSTCFFLMDEEQCLFNEELHLQHHLNIFKKLELLGDINGFNITYNVVCLKDETGYVYYHKPIIHEEASRNTKLFDSTECESYAITELNENKTTCKNVVVGFNYKIFVNGTVLRSIKVTILTVNIPLNIKELNISDRGVLNPLLAAKKNVTYALQKIFVKFEDLVDSVKKHGYVLGMPIYLRG